MAKSLYYSCNYIVRYKKSVFRDPHIPIFKSNEIQTSESIFQLSLLAMLPQIHPWHSRSSTQSKHDLFHYKLLLIEHLTPMHC